MWVVIACTFQVIGSFYQSCWEFTFFSFVTSVFIIVCWKIFSVAALKSLSAILTSVIITSVLSCHWCVLTLFSNLSWNTPGSWYDIFGWNLHVWGMWWHYGSYLKVCYSRRLLPLLWWGKDSLIIAWQGWKCRFLTRFCWPMMGGEGQKELVIVGEGGNSGSSVILPWLGRAHYYSIPWPIYHLYWHHRREGLPCYDWEEWKSRSSLGFC